MARNLFLQSEVEYLHYWIYEKGIYILPAKLEAIQKAPTSTDTVKLWPFVDLLNFCGKFIPNLSTMVCPLNVNGYNNVKALFYKASLALSSVFCFSSP